jgi:hypothetical protein
LQTVQHARCPVICVFRIFIKSVKNSHLILFLLCGTGTNPCQRRSVAWGALCAPLPLLCGTARGPRPAWAALAGRSARRSVPRLFSVARRWARVRVTNRGWCATYV